eukprot:13445256-Alexandrium_andersonii.AAC.1
MSTHRSGQQPPILLKTGREPALTDIRRGVAKRWASGSVENRARQFKELVHTLVRLKGEIPSNRPVVFWGAAYAKSHG